MLEKLRETPSGVSIKNGADMKYERRNKHTINERPGHLVETSPVGQGTDNLTERSLSVAGCREVHN